MPVVPMNRAARSFFEAKLLRMGIVLPEIGLE